MGTAAVIQSVFLKLLFRDLKCDKNELIEKGKTNFKRLSVFNIIFSGNVLCILLYKYVTYYLHQKFSA